MGKSGKENTGRKGRKKRGEQVDQINSGERMGGERACTIQGNKGKGGKPRRGDGTQGKRKNQGAEGTSAQNKSRKSSRAGQVREKL